MAKASPANHVNNNPKQLLAFDFGLRQIGVATGSSISKISSELTTLYAKDGKPDWDQVGKLISEWKPDLCLVGLPLNMDSSESELSIRARKFSRQISGRFGIEVELVDERLTSFEAKGISANSGHKGDFKKAPVDALAARLLVDQWFNETL